MNNTKCLSSPYSIQNLLCNEKDSITQGTKLAPIKNSTSFKQKFNSSISVPFIELPQPFRDQRNKVNHHEISMNHGLLTPLSSPSSSSIEYHGRSSPSVESSLYKHIDYWKKYDVWAYRYNQDHSNKDDFMKIKRRRATAIQTQNLQKVFERTAFPSTILRENLARSLGMSPRTVQIWFQNRRQAMRRVYKTI